MPALSVRTLLLANLFLLLPCVHAAKPIQLFVLAGDECVLEEGVVAAKDKPGTLEEVIKAEPRFAFLKDKDGQWVTRDDVMLYDAHPIHNNTEAPARALPVVTDVTLNQMGPRTGIHLMLGHTLGNAIDNPVLIHRYAVTHPIWFMRGSRDLDHNYRPPSSGGNPDLKGSWDVIHFNFGVWDACYREPTSKYYSGYRTTSVEDFEKNLRTLVAKMKKTGATLIWGSVTPVWEGEPGKPNGDEDAYNRVAAKVMMENGVIINDLNAYSRSLGFPKTNDVHSVGILAPQVTKTILEALASRKESTKPQPRVLLIGDSITGSYQGQVFKDLDGKAAVFKNPGNGEDTWNGLERMDEWLDLSKYLMNGQEYLELVDSIHKAMGEELSRIDAQHAAGGVELAGIFWLQGIQDGMWDSKAANYEEHLANLIRDLRKEFKNPKLPVVVGALAGADKMNPNQQKVFDAQLAVGNPEKYPEFKGTVRSIDTLPLSYPAKDCPGGRDRYKGHAGSYLQIGEVMAKAMLELKGHQSTNTP